MMVGRGGRRSSRRISLRIFAANIMSGASANRHLSPVSRWAVTALSRSLFRRHEQFAAAAATQPLLEPGLRDSDIGARNRLHHMVGGPRELLGANRDAVFQANNPANLLRAGADAIKESGLAIYLEVGDQDFLNAHDGTEFLHRILWDLDIAHEYRLLRGADHGGPTLIPRMRDAFAWLGSVATQLQNAATPSQSADARAVAD